MGLPTKAPPGSATKKPRQLRESDGNSGELLLEKFLYRTDPYRSSSAETPFSYPPRNSHRLDPTRDDRLRRDVQPNTDIRNILVEYWIEIKFYEFCYLSKLHSCGGEERITVLRVLVNVEDLVSTSNCQRARWSLSKMLHDRDFDLITAEILDPARINALTLLPIASDHPVLALYESFGEKLIIGVMRSLGKFWTTICLFSLYQPSQEPTLAVLLSVRPGTAYNWRILRSKLQMMISSETDGKTQP